MNTDNAPEQRGKPTAPLRHKDEERRHFAAGEIRAAGSTNAPRLEGFAALYQDETMLTGDIREIIRPGAFARVVKEASSSTVCLVNHDTAQLLGRVPNTLRLEDRKEGLWFSVDIPDTQVGRDTWESVRRGDLSGCSFSFQIGRDRFSTDRAGVTTREILEISRLFDVGPVVHPQYTSTSVAARKRGGPPMTLAEVKRRYAATGARLAELDRRIGYRRPAVAAPSQVRADLEALRARRDRLATRALLDPGVRWRTEAANRAEQRRRSEGGPSGAIFDRGYLRAPE